MVGRIATTNTVPHETNAIDITPLVANSIADLLSDAASPTAPFSRHVDP
jgi:hypothetical protein